MKLKYLVAGITAASLLAPVLVHAEDSDADRVHPMVYVKDSIITTKIKAKLADDKVRSLAHIKVDTDQKGVVLLSGTARSQEEIDRAIAIARATEGVTAVKSALQIKLDK